MLDIFEIVAMLESHSLVGNQYVFELRKREWIRVCDIEILVDTGFHFEKSGEFAKPSFLPPHKLPVDHELEENNSDYQYLLAHYRSESRRLEGLKDKSLELKQNAKESFQLEQTIVELNEKIIELDNVVETKDDIRDELENIVVELKSELNQSNELISNLEKSLVQKEISLKDIEDLKQKELDEFKLESKNSIVEAKEFKSKVESLTYTIRSLKFALRVEKEKYEDLKNVISTINEKKEGDVVKDKVIEQAFNYFIQGPIGDGTTGLEIEKLTKKISFLENELADQEEQFKKRLNDKDKTAAEEKEIYRVKVTDLEQRYQVKISDLGNDKRELRARISSLESDLERANEKSDALINTVSKASHDVTSSTGDNSLQEKFDHLKKRYDDAVENYETMMNQKDLKISEILSDQYNTKGEESSNDSAVEYLKAELMKYKNLAANSTKEKDVLSGQIKKLSTQRMELAKKIDHQASMINQYKSTNNQLSKQLNELESKAENYKSEYKKLHEKNNKAIKKIQDQSSKISNLNSAKEDELVQSQKEVDDLVNKMLDLQAESRKEKKKAKELEESLKKIKEQKSEAKIELDTEYSGTDSSSDVSSGEEELKRLIGDSYEVLNDSAWTVQFEDGMKTGPHPYSVLYDMKEKGEINSDTRVKKEGEGFKACKDIFELSTRVFVHGEGDNRRFFIKRNSVRVPYYELITFEMGDKEFRGYCTSISSGGIFIELSSLKESELALDAKGRVFFPRGAIETPFNCVAQIKNISTSRPKGIGLMFVDLKEESKNDILDYVNNYLNQTKKTA